MVVEDLEREIPRGKRVARVDRAPVREEDEERGESDAESEAKLAARGERFGVTRCGGQGEAGDAEDIAGMLPAGIVRAASPRLRASGANAGYSTSSRYSSTGVAFGTVTCAVFEPVPETLAEA